MLDQSLPHWAAVRRLATAFVLLAALLAGLLAAWSGVAAAAEVRLTESGFEPGEATVAAGETIVWMNSSNRTATIVGPDGAWDSGPLAPGETFSIALRQEGTVRYATLDGLATGSLVIEGSVPSAVAEPVQAALPRTGAGVLPVLLLALGLLVAGVALVTRPRRGAAP